MHVNLEGGGHSRAEVIQFDEEDETKPTSFGSG